VDDDNGTITFNAPDDFTTGQAVVYGNASGAGNIGGLTPGTTYFVRVINPTTITLCTSATAAEAPLQAFAPTAVSGSGTINLPSNGFSNNEAVTYQGPQTQFLGTAVNGGNEIEIGPSQTGNALQNNAQVVYSVGAQTSTATPAVPATQLSGLTVGATYYVYRVDANTIELSTTAVTVNSKGTPIPPCKS
jgi:hypothetical protein